MIRSALVLAAGLLAALCFACVPPPPLTGGTLPPPPPAGRVATLSATCSDGTPFLSRVLFVQNGWKPSTSSTRPPDDPPSMTGTLIDLTSNYAQDLQSAFARASQDFRDRLCNLAAIYVNGPSDCGNFANCVDSSWGYRASPSKRQYVAISAGLWNQTCQDGSPYVYHCFESDVLNQVLDPTHSDPTPPQYSAANSGADTFDMIVLAVLAHETGHAVWYEAMNPGHSGSHGYNPDSFCQRAFFPTSWQGRIHEPPFWRAFGKRGAGAHLFFPDISDIENAKQSGNWPVVISLLEQLYRRDQPWASYFASISPDEDFVETFKLVVLTTAQLGRLTNLQISLAGVPHDIPADLLAGNKSGLFNKAGCVAPWIKPPPPSRRR